MKFEVQDYTNILPWHPTRMWGQRPLNYIKNIVIHQSACILTYEQINKMHITPGPKNHISPKGCPHIAYHIGIRPNGKVIKMNEYKYITWGAKGHNMHSIHINVNGNFAGAGWKGQNEPTQEQLFYLRFLLDYLYKNDFKHLDARDSLKMHCELDPINRLADPGYIITELINKYRVDIK